MNKRVKRVMVWGIPCFLAGVVLLCRWMPAAAEIYARTCYPFFTAVLSAFSSLWPFSLGDCFIVGACLWLIIYPLYAWKRRKSLGHVLGKTVRFLLWIYIWFYFAWGINYFRPDFYSRTGIAKAEYSPEEFRQFLEEYTGGLNEVYKKTDTCAAWYTSRWAESGGKITLLAENEVTRGYQQIATHYKLVRPAGVLRPKQMLWSKGFSQVGVTGYMGPFFAEFNLNRELLNVEYPFTYAHELAHRLGVAGEAEANLHAYLITTRSSADKIRFSGYFSLLGYVLNNARRLLPEAEYRLWLSRIPPTVVDMYNKHLSYWRGKYNPSVGKVQNKVYNAYLKGNRISSGTKNYSEVIGLLMSVQRAKKDQLKASGINYNQCGSVPDC